MKISVFGLGYVGLVSSVCLANIGHKVIGVENQKNKVELINSGQVPFYEKGVKSLLKKNLRKNLLVTSDVQFAIKNSDISIICVGTELNKKGNLNLKNIDKVFLQITKYLKNKASRHYILIRSTTYPGTINYLLKKLKNSNKIINCEVVSNPEFLREGNAIEDFMKPSFTLFGLNKKNETDKKILSGIYKTKRKNIFFEEIKVAEMMKFTNNYFHALKICFANEIGSICKNQNISSSRIMDLLKADRKLNISTKYLSPGFAYGGSCLTKDVEAFSNFTKKNSINLPILSNIKKSNETVIRRCQIYIEKLIPKKNSKISIFGLSFKNNSDDLRGSQYLKLYNLIKKKYNVKLYDNVVIKSKLIGQNLDIYNSNKLKIVRYSDKNLDNIIKSSKVVIPTIFDQKIFNYLKKNKSVLVLDINNNYKKLNLRKSYFSFV